MEQSWWSVSDSFIIEFFQEQSLATQKTVDGSVYGQLCLLTLEATQYTGLASSGKHSGKHLKLSEKL